MNNCMPLSNIDNVVTMGKFLERKKLPKLIKKEQNKLIGL